MKLRICRYGQLSATLLFISLFSGGCSVISSINPFSGPSSEQREGDRPALPFSLEVTDEVNDGDRLHVLGAVAAATEWQLSDVVVKLTSFSEGKPVGVSYLPLGRDKGPTSMIGANDKFRFTISVPAASITDYQLELLWGEEAKLYLQSVGQGSRGVLEIRNIQVETIRQPCPSTECTVTFRAKAQLYNATDRIINKVVLGIGYLRQPRDGQLDLQPQIPQNEEQIDVGAIALAPGSHREIVINFDKELPERDLVTDEGEIKPSIRIHTFATD